MLFSSAAIAPDTHIHITHTAPIRVVVVLLECVSARPIQSSRSNEIAVVAVNCVGLILLRGWGSTSTLLTAHITVGRPKNKRSMSGVAVPVH